MNILKKVTLKAMRHNRVRTIVTIIGIILSTSMFTAVTTFCSSLVQFFKETMIYESGNYHIGTEETDGSSALSLLSDSRVKEASLAEYVGYAEIGSKNEEKPYLYIEAGNTAFFEHMPIHLIAGRLPETDTELLLPEHLLRNGGVSIAPGETLCLSLGDRITDGFSLTQNTPYFEEEGALTLRMQKTYTVVGLYERPSFESYYAPGYTALTKTDAPIQENARYCLYLLLKSPAKNLDAYLSEHLEAASAPAYTLNYDILMFSGILRYANWFAMLASLAFIFCALIFAGSVSLIYSAFSISVSERTKQFGLLSSIGATKKQLRKSVLTEALTVSAIGIPLGILAGIAGMGVTLYFCGGLFNSLVDVPFPLRFSISWPSLLLAAVIALGTVLVSAWIPSRRAMKVTAMDAIRQSRDIKAEKKAVRYSRLFYKVFGVEGVLAKKYYRRSRKKYRATILSLAMSVILFISASAFGMYLTQTVDDSISVSRFDLAYYSSESLATTVSFSNSFAAVTGVKECAVYSDAFGCLATASFELLTKEYTDFMELSGREALHVQIRYVEDAAFDRLLLENGLDREDYYNPASPKALVLNHINTTLYMDDERQSYSLEILKEGVTTLSLLEESEQSDLIEEKKTLSLGAFLSTAPMGAVDGDVLQLFYPASLCETPDTISANVYLRSEHPKETLAAFRELLKDTGLFSYADDNFYDSTKYEAQMRNILLLINVFSYGFIVLISLISVANVFNTISTNIALRRRDYAMLRSIGMTDRGLHRMMNYECLLYGTRALLLGLPISFGITYLIYKSTNFVLSDGFTLPWNAVSIAVLCVFLVVFITMLYAMSKIKKENPIDALKNEAI